METSPAVKMITIDNYCWYERCDNGMSALSESCGICCMNAQGRTVFWLKNLPKKQDKAKRWGEIRCQKMKGWGSSV